jgi:hypothetical protein
MKIIDHTPFFNNDTGEISFLDRAKAMMKYGSSWIKEVEAQKQIITVLGKVLDRNYTLLCNVKPPGLEASFPFILVGPTGVFVMYVTPLCSAPKGTSGAPLPGIPSRMKNPT